MNTCRKETCADRQRGNIAGERLKKKEKKVQVAGKWHRVIPPVNCMKSEKCVYLLNLSMQKLQKRQQCKTSSVKAI